MNYLSFGSSKNVIVFLHGWGADKNSFLWIKNYFDDYTTIFIDFYGHGDSVDAKSSYCLDDFVYGVKNILDKFEIDKLVIVGHSFGGRVAIKYASYFQNKYKCFKLCLVDSAGIKPKHGLKYYCNVLRFKIYKKLAQKNNRYKNKLCSFGSLDYKNLSDDMKPVFVRIVNEDLSLYASGVNIETLIVWGSEDKDTKPYMAKRLNKLIKNSQLCFIKNAGHFSFLDNREEFVFLLDRFLKNL